jgi:hypothetical protein
MQIKDFRVTNVGYWIYLLLLDGEGKEVIRLQLSWMSGLRLLGEARTAVALAMKVSPEKKKR